jgi:hypothetical protein
MWASAIFVHFPHFPFVLYDRLRYFKGDYEAINEVLANVDWELLLATGSIDAAESVLIHPASV